MAIVIDDVVLPPEFALGSTGGPRFKTSITETGAGAENRARYWNSPLWTWEIEYANFYQSKDTGIGFTAANLVDFYEAREGPTRGFLFHPPIGGNVPGQTPYPLTVSGTWQTVRRWMSGGVTREDFVLRPILDTFVLSVNEAIIPSGYTVSGTTGVISYTPPALELYFIVDRNNNTDLTCSGLDQLEIYQSSLTYLTGRIGALGATNKTGLITFEDTPTLEQALTTNEALTEAAIAAIAPSSSGADPGAAIDFAVAQMEADGSPGTIKMFVFASDGQDDFNNGVAAVEALKAAHPDWRFFALNLDAENVSMRAIGQAGDGLLYGRTPNLENKALETVLNTWFSVECDFYRPCIFTGETAEFVENGIQRGFPTSFAEVREEGAVSIVTFYNGADETSIDEIPFPVRFTTGTEGGSGFNTFIRAVDSGWQKAIPFYDRSLGQIAYNVKNESKAHMEEVLEHYLCRFGQQRAFLLENVFEYVASRLMFEDEELVSLGGGEYQLVKRYTSDRTVTTNITRPQCNSVTLYDDGVEVDAADYIIDYFTGIISGYVPMGTLTASGRFYIIARYDEQQMRIQLHSPIGISSWAPINFKQVDA